MPALLPVILTGSYLMLAADRVPQLDTDRSCHAATMAATSPNRNEDACKRDERSARDKLEQQWGQYTPGQQTHCASLSRMGGPPSYVELLTCLEMAKAADSLPDEDRAAGKAGK